MDELHERLAEVRERVAQAAVASGRPPAAVTIVAAAKQQSIAAQAAVVAAGIAHLGHNYAQEASAARAVLDQPAVWHLIGHLQRNKAGLAAELFDRVDTLDSARLADALGRRREPVAGPLPVLLQVRLGGEASKSGVEPEEAGRLLEAVQQTGGLVCLGLMTMPPPGSIAESRRWFARLRELAERLRRESGDALPVLSMGMSQDYEAAIAEGSTEVRLGTAIFGQRAG